jgi:hypothetical protein
MGPPNIGAARAFMLFPGSLAGRATFATHGVA